MICIGILIGFFLALVIEYIMWGHKKEMIANKAKELVNKYDRCIDMITLYKEMRDYLEELTEL